VLSRWQQQKSAGTLSFSISPKTKWKGGPQIIRPQLAAIQQKCHLLALLIHKYKFSIGRGEIT